MQEHPSIEQWLTKPYAEGEVATVLSNLKNNKSMGTDGIPGEAYKILGATITTFILELMNNITAGQPMPENWKIGAITHIHKKNSTQECANYRPICLTQIIYKIWFKLQTAGIARILHLLTSNNQFGYKNGLSTIDAIIKIEKAIQAGTPKTKIILMDLSKAFDCVNRNTLWSTLYKAGLPIHTQSKTYSKGTKARNYNARTMAPMESP